MDTLGVPNLLNPISAWLREIFFSLSLSLSRNFPTTLSVIKFSKREREKKNQAKREKIL